MKRASLLFTAPETVAVEVESLHEPMPGEVLVRSTVSAISAGSELLLYRGQQPVELAADATIPALAGGLDYPRKYGYANVGEIIQLGTGVAESWRGRLVFAFHPHESHFCARPEQLIPVPAGLTAETAVFLPNMETAVSFLMDGQPLIGEQVAVLGQGVVGLLTTALLAQLPLAQLVTFDRFPQRRSWSKQMGAHASLDPHHVSLPDLFPDAAFAGADLTYELSGNPGAINAAIDLTGDNGRIVLGSWYGTKEAPLALGGRFHRSQIRLLSSQVSRLAPRWLGRWHKKRRLQVAWQMLARVEPAQLISHRFPFHKAGAAYELLHQQPETALQVLLTHNE